MAGYLSETDFVMVEEGFSTRDLLEELTLGASQATAGDVAAFFVADLGAVVRKHFCFLKCLPRVRPFYMVKCNSSPGVLKVLAELGLGFSCANKALSLLTITFGTPQAEMELVQRIGVPASKIVYANPCKQIAQIKYAAKHGVRLLSFDNEAELAKVVKSHPSAKMVLCIATDESHSLSPLSFKFGASLKSCRHLLENAKRSHVEVVGVSFHIGSGCPDLHAYTQSIADARLVFEMGAELGHGMHILDLGGGFPGLEGAKVRFEEKSSAEQPLYSSSLWGPVADGRDRVAEGLWLPQLHVGDWLVFENMGAYTVGMASPLGGTQTCRVTYAMSRVAWEALRGQLLPAEQEEDAEGMCKPLSCGWEITDTLCVGPVFTPASIITYQHSPPSITCSSVHHLSAPPECELGSRNFTFFTARSSLLRTKKRYVSENTWDILTEGRYLWRDDTEIQLY
uniref:Antizyme inhibitor 2 isoform X7 n=1 Tax=Callorhinus ursinus TaxID=34884 RepID=A0A3Q7MVK0_CALUR|nr:antizyme inhibitor 2 isoform X7 [Callorhinus ursinus]